MIRVPEGVGSALMEPRKIDDPPGAAGLGF